MSEFSEALISCLVIAGKPITYGIVQPGPDISPDGIPLIRGKDYNSSGKLILLAFIMSFPRLIDPMLGRKFREETYFFQL